MNKENITKRQAVSMISLFIVGSSLVMGMSKYSKQDAWMGMLIAMAAMMPVIYFYARLLHRYPGKDVFEISIAVFGKILGRVVIALFAWYGLHLGALVLKNFSQFIQVTAFNQMPQTISLICMMVLVIWVSKRGIEVLGRWSAVVLPILMIIVAATVLLLIKDMKISNLLPVGENINMVPKDAWADFTFPFAESVLFLGVLNVMQKGDKPGKAWVYGVLVGGAILLFGGLLRNILVLGFPSELDFTFPSYSAVSIIIAGSVVSRIENVVGANLLMAGFVKISICLIAASKGTARLINADDYRPLVAPLGLLMVALASIIGQNIFQMFDFLSVYMVYALPFQVIIPILLCITAEIKFIIKSRKEQGGAAPAGEQKTAPEGGGNG
jgi:spore germination protein KB